MVSQYIKQLRNIESNFLISHVDSKYLDYHDKCGIT